MHFRQYGEGLDSNCFVVQSPAIERLNGEEEGEEKEERERETVNYRKLAVVVIVSKELSVAVFVTSSDALLSESSAASHRQWTNEPRNDAAPSRLELSEVRRGSKDEAKAPGLKVTVCIVCLGYRLSREHAHGGREEHN